MKKWQKTQIYGYGKVKLSHDFFCKVLLGEQLRKDYQSQDDKTLAAPDTINEQTIYQLI